MAYNNQPFIRIKGNLVAGKAGETIEVREFKDGTEYVFFKVAVENGEDRDGNRLDATFYNVRATGALARNLAASLVSGEAPVHVYGRIRAREAVVVRNDEEYDDWTVQVDAYDVAVGLEFGTVEYTKVAGKKGGGKSTRAKDEDDDEKPARRSSRSKAKDEESEDEADEKPTRRRRSRAVDADEDGNF